MHFRLFSVQIYRCSVQNRLLHTNIRSFCVQNLSFSVESSMLLRTNRMLFRGKFDASPHKSNASPWKIRYFFVQIKSFCVVNSMFLSANQKFSRAKFDASPYKSKAIESFSVEIYTVSELGDLGPPSPGQQIAEIIFLGREVVLFVKTFFLSLRNGVVLLSLR